jgi:predicted NAD-dependent protein-ADP-ribosyltransferase YbiA (DUF1768 family)
MIPDTLFFFSKSADKPVGKGTNEHVSNPQDYMQLGQITHWRKILSNFYVAPFVWRDRTWNSVEHAFQASKIALVDSVKSEWFTMESGHELGQGDGCAARKCRKLVLLNSEKLQEWNRMKSGLMEDILYAKFSQIDLPRKVLLATGNAVLLHGARGPVERQIELEKVRERLNGFK